MSLWKRMKSAVGSYLERLAAENKEVLGDGRPDCCKLNRKTMNKKRK